MGVYARIGGTTTVIADRNTPYPGTATAFTIPTSNSLIVGDAVAFWGGTTGANYAVFVNQGGTITPAPSPTSALPHGTGEFASNLSVLRDFNGARTLFTAASVDATQRGVYLSDLTGVVTRVADRTTTIPGMGSTTFAQFDSAKLAGERVVFTGSPGGTLQLFTTVPGGTVTAITSGPSGFSSGVGDVFATDGGNVVFRDRTFNGLSDAMYLAPADGTGSIQRLLGIGDTFDGKTISSFAFGAEGFDGGNLAFSVRFTDNTSGLYFAPVPEPASVLAVAAGGLAVLAARRRRRRTS